MKIQVMNIYILIVIYENSGNKVLYSFDLKCFCSNQNLAGFSNTLWRTLLYNTGCRAGGTVSNL